MAQVSLEVSHAPQQEGLRKSKKGRQRQQAVMSRTYVGLFAQHLPLGKQISLIHAMLMGLSVRQWSKGWICDLSKANQ